MVEVCQGGMGSKTKLWLFPISMEALRYPDILKDWKISAISSEEIFKLALVSYK